jgi:hypothetical protein
MAYLFCTVFFHCRPIGLISVLIIMLLEKCAILIIIITVVFIIIIIIINGAYNIHPHSTVSKACLQ